GNLIALGTIRGDRLVAGTEIYSPVIKSGLIESPIIRGGRIEGVTGDFSGTVKADKIIGDICKCASINIRAFGIGGGAGTFTLLDRTVRSDVFDSFLKIDGINYGMTISTNQTKAYCELLINGSVVDSFMLSGAGNSLYSRPLTGAVPRNANIRVVFRIRFATQNYQVSIPAQVNLLMMFRQM
ncbi:MAG: hypothetical protein ACRCYD_03015, partial [Plesiomonas sp.]